MRVLQVGGLAGPEAIAGGVWSVATTQARALRDDGTDVVLLGGWLGAVPTQPSEPAASLYRVRRPFPGAELRGLVSLSFVIRVWRELGRVDVGHIHLSRDFLTTMSLALFRLRGVPVVVQTHGMYGPASSRVVRMFDLIFRRLFLRTPALWITLSPSERDRLISLGVPPRRTIEVANATSAPHSRWTAPPAEPRFAFISRLHPRKQPLLLLDAASEIEDSGRRATFVWAGPDQGELDELLQEITKRGMSESCSYAGALSTEEVHALLSSATALVLPSIGEIYPMIAIEAAAVGTPLIITADSAISSMLEEAGAAIVISPDKDDLVNALKLAIDEPQTLDRLSHHASQLHAEKWGTSKLASDLADAYASVVGRPSSS